MVACREGHFLVPSPVCFVAVFSFGLGVVKLVRIFSSVVSI